MVFDSWIDDILWKGNASMKQRLCTSISIILCTVGVLAWAFFFPVPSALATPISQSCGEVDTHGSTPYSPNANQIEHCFWQASRICADKTLTFHVMGIDSGSTRQFWITPKCQIHESLDTYIVPLFHHHIANIACNQAKFFSDGLHILGCTGDPSIVIPFQ